MLAIVNHFVFRSSDGLPERVRAVLLDGTERDWGSRRKLVIYSLRPEIYIPASTSDVVTS